ncbi:hypothetical protein [Variovorax sp. GT1P44]|uniref:hypothetical protein n=1 Tax=Variovorax sp. GT1P44 TaxID=3443742 RepID=UPI003F460A01
MSKELDRLRHLVAKMQVRYGESDPDVQQLVEDVNALEVHEARERRTFQAQEATRRWDRGASRVHGTGPRAS